CSSAVAEDKKCKENVFPPRRKIKNVKRNCRPRPRDHFSLIPSWRIDTLRIKKYDDGTRIATPEFTERQ
ncbi:MAG: hypothetical protein ACFNVH_10205, partial [Segatella maculosa]